MLEFNHMHANVLTQPDFDDQCYSGNNSYALGFAMMGDIRRICTEPTDEDREWFPEIAGNDDWRATLRHAWENYRDESFIQQFLSPHLIRKFGLFALCDDEKYSHYTITDIHDERHLKLQHTMHDRIPLAEKSRGAVLEQVRKLWGYDVSLIGVDAETDEVLYEAGSADGDGV